MKRIASLSLLLALAVPVLGAPPATKLTIVPDEATQARDIISIGRGVTLEEGMTAKDVVVIFGSADLRGTVQGSVAVVGGSVRLFGTVEDDLVSIGSAWLGPNAVVKGDAVTVGGSMTLEKGAKVLQDKVELSLLRPFENFPWIKDWLRYGLLWARPLPHQLPWAWGVAAGFLILALLTAACLPVPVERCRAALEERPMHAVAAGLLGLTLTGPLAFVLLSSIVGIVVLPFLACALLAGAYVGKVALCGTAGSRLGKGLGVEGLSRPLPAVLIGTSLLTLFYAVPLLGLMAWALAGTIGLGAALMAAFEALRGEEGDPKVAVGNPLVAAPAPSQGAAPAPAASDSTLLPRAGFWVRAGATAIDAMVFIVAAAILPVLTVGLIGWALYQIGFWTWKGTTLGGIVFGIKGVRLDGRPMDFTVALIRHLASYLSLLALGIGFFWAGWDPERQTWHDKIAGTTVVRVPKGEALI